MPERRRLFSIPLVRELTIVLIIKLIVIFSIRAAFFSDPVDLTDPQQSIDRQLGLLSSEPEEQHDQ